MDWIGRVDIFFTDTEMRRRFTIDQETKRIWGTDRAKQIRKRLDDLSAAPNLEEMKRLPGKCHELSGDRRGQLSLSVSGNYRLIFEPANDPLPLKPDGGLDWSRVTAVKVIEVEDYHG